MTTGACPISLRTLCRVPQDIVSGSEAVTVEERACQSITSIGAHGTSQYLYRAPFYMDRPHGLECEQPLPAAPVSWG